MLNTLNVNLNTDLKVTRVPELGIKIKSQDINNNLFILRFTDKGKAIELDETYTVEILTKFEKSKSHRLTSATVYRDYARWEFDTAYITQDEKVTNYVYVRKSGSLIVSADANAFAFDVGLSEIDKDAGRVAEVYDENYEKYLDEFKDNVDFEEIAQAEQARKEAELLREKNYNQKVDTAIVEADVVSKVDSKVTELTPQINDLTAQLAQKADIADLPSSAYTFKGTTTFALLPTTGNVLGDVRYTTDNLVNYAWNGTAWVAIGNGAFTNGSVTTAKIANGATTPTKTSFLELDKTVNLWDGLYYNKRISGAPGSLILEESFAGRTIIIPIPNNTTLTLITDVANSNRFFYGLSSVRIEVGTFDGLNSYLSSSRIVTVNTGNSNWLYLNTSNESKTPFVQVAEGTLTGFTVSELMYAPKSNINIYNKTDVQNELSELKTEIETNVAYATERKLKVIKTGESMKIYIPSKRSERYTAYTFERYSRSVKDVDVWRIYDISIVDVNLNQLYTLNNGYDVDGVVKIVGEADYIGGFHGYENMNAMSVLVDGIEKDMLIDFTQDCRSVKITVKSVITNYGLTTKAFDKFKVLEFTKDGVDIYSKYIAAATANLESARLCLLSIEKTSGETTLINKYTENYNFLPTSIPTNGADSTTLVYNSLIDEIEFYGAEIYAFMSRGKSTESNKRGSVVDFTSRMKGYLDCVRDTTINLNDIIENNSHYEIYS